MDKGGPSEPQRHLILGKYGQRSRNDKLEDPRRPRLAAGATRLEIEDPVRIRYPSLADQGPFDERPQESGR